MALSEKHELFCQHYATSHNAAEAARYAGYSEKSAANTGSRLINTQEIQTRVEEISQELTTDINVIRELEIQYMHAKANNNSSVAIKALEQLGRLRGNADNTEHESEETLEREIIRCLEILGEEKTVELVSRCKWNYSLPTPEEVEEAEEMVKKQTKEDK